MDDTDAETGDEETYADDEDGAAEEDSDAAEAEAEEPGVVISIAREVDAQGWIGEAAALQLTGLQTESTLRTSAIEGELEAGADPHSDLWWHTAEGTDEAARLRLPHQVRLGGAPAGGHPEIRARGGGWVKSAPRSH